MAAESVRATSFGCLEIMVVDDFSVQAFMWTGSLCVMSAFCDEDGCDIARQSPDKDGNARR